VSKLIERWARDDDAKSAWASFIAEPEFEQGMRVLEVRATPVINIGESMEATAQRQLFQAGFHAALAMIRQLPDFTEKVAQEQLPEWGHVEPEQDTDENIRKILDDGE